MKKKISRWLFSIATKLNKDVVLECNKEAKPIGITIHISKRDVRDYRKDHPEIKSHREGMKRLIEEAKFRVAGIIGRGLLKHDVISFNVKKTLYVADVSGVAFVYAEKEQCEEQ